RERRNILGWDESKYSRIVDTLILKEIIEKVSVPNGRGRPLLLYQPKGKNPSIKHEYYVHWIVDRLAKRGLVCTTNKVGPDIRIPKIRTAINVELGSSDILGNITSSLEEFDKIVVCSDDTRVLEAIRSHIKPEEAKRVFIHFIWDIPKLIADLCNLILPDRFCDRKAVSETRLNEKGMTDRWSGNQGE
ncbi:MAG: hypothetical protein QXW73_04735, partial [Nitrososphaerales archaeon]